MFNISILPHGTLKVSADNTTRQEIADRIAAGQSEPMIFTDLMEAHSCNGSFTPFDAGNANPFVGLTEAPCIAEEMDFDDEGNANLIGRLWYFADYAIKSELQDLKNLGRAFFTLASEV